MSSPWRQADGPELKDSPARSSLSIPQLDCFTPSKRVSVATASTEKETYIRHSTTNPNIKDSIEDLPSSVPRSPQATYSPRRLDIRPEIYHDQPSPSQQSSPLLPEFEGTSIDTARNPETSRPAAQNFIASTALPLRDPALFLEAGSPCRPQPHPKRSNLKLTLDGDSWSFNGRVSRPLSPFTRGGFLRRAVSNEGMPRPPSHSSARAESAGPWVGAPATEKHTEKSSDGGKAGQKEKLVNNHSKAQRLGHPFLGFLGRRSAT